MLKKAVNNVLTNKAINKTAATIVNVGKGQTASPVVELLNNSIVSQSVQPLISTPRVNQYIQNSPVVENRSEVAVNVPQELVNNTNTKDMKLGQKILAAAEKYTGGVDKVLQSNAIVTALSAAAATSGVPGMDKVLKGIEKIIPDGGIKFTKLGNTSNGGVNVGSGSKTLSGVGTEQTGLNTSVVTFDWKKWSTYPKWAQYVLIGIVPAGLLIYLLMGDKKNKKRY
jgi:hypothetical protein